jgi:hypothetical protein
MPNFMACKPGNLSLRGQRLTGCQQKRLSASHIFLGLPPGPSFLPLPPQSEEVGFPSSVGSHKEIMMVFFISLQRTVASQPQAFEDQEESRVHISSFWSPFKEF